MAGLVLGARQRGDEKARVGPAAGPFGLRDNPSLASRSGCELITHHSSGPHSLPGLASPRFASLRILTASEGVKVKTVVGYASIASSRALASLRSDVSNPSGSPTPTRSSRTLICRQREPAHLRWRDVLGRGREGHLSQREFAVDSPLEESGFEPVVPATWQTLSRAS